MVLEISNLRCVVFDWDNTLAKTRSTLLKTVNLVLEEFGMPSWNEVNKRYDHKLSFRDNFPNVFGFQSSKAYERYAELYKEQIENSISTFPCVQQTLDFFYQRKIPIIVMSNKDRCLLDYELPMLFNPKIFDKVVAGHEAPKDKPFPDHAYYAVAKYVPAEKITPDQVWVIGDSFQDSDCALAVNALAIRIGKPIWTEDCLLDDRIVHFDDFCSFHKSLLEAIKLGKI